MCIETNHCRFSKSNKDRLLLLALMLLAVFMLFSADKLYARDFNDMTISEFGKLVADRTGYTVLYAPRVRTETKITIYSGQDFNDEELYQLFLSVLRLHGYTAVLRENIVRVVRSRSARSQPVPVQVE